MHNINSTGVFTAHVLHKDKYHLLNCKLLTSVRNKNRLYFISKENKNEDEDGVINIYTSSVDSNASEAQNENNKTRSRLYLATLGINDGNINCTHFDKNLNNSSNNTGAEITGELDINYRVKTGDKNSNTIRLDVANSNQRKLF